jgi:hypothetical protein
MTKPNEYAAISLLSTNEEFQIQLVVLRHRDRAPEHTQVEARDRLQRAIDQEKGTPARHSPVF